MPIVRTFMCPACGHRLQATLSMEQWDEPPPECPQCIQEPMDIDFRPIALGGSLRAKAARVAETIAAEDYDVADMQMDSRQGGKPKVRYKEPKELKELAAKVAREARLSATDNRHAPSNWAAAQETLLQAVAVGRQTRMMSGGKSGLDILQANIKSGVEPDKIANSKKLSARIW